MGIEDDIRYKIHQGIPIKTLIENEGYKKSTAYKVLDTIKTYSRPVNQPEWSIERIQFNKSDWRYMPGDAVRITFSFRNQSQRDLYIINIGIQTEWMVNEKIWYSQSLKELLKPNQTKFISISFPIPKELHLGEYELLFGVEGQFLPAQENTGNITTSWSDPVILHIKHPFSNNKIFLSHSIHDKFLVRELEKKMDEQGIETFVGEDISNPGSILEDKFKRLIEKSNIFICLLTRPALESPWVNLEIEYAKKLNKPMILLKDRTVSVNSSIEWLEFSSNDPPQDTFHTIMSAIDKLKNNNNLDGLVAGVVGIGLLALLASALSDK